MERGFASETLGLVSNKGPSPRSGRQTHGLQTTGLSPAPRAEIIYVCMVLGLRSQSLASPQAICSRPLRGLKLFSFVAPSGITHQIAITQAVLGRMQMILGAMSTGQLTRKVTGMAVTFRVLKVLLSRSAVKTIRPPITSPPASLITPSKNLTDLTVFLDDTFLVT